MSNLLCFFSKSELEELEKKDSYSKAEKIVERLFKEKTDKGGNPYLEHLYYVSNKLEDLNMKTVGLLHDLLEDTNITASDLKQMGFTDEIIEALIIITKDGNDLYDEYINKILESHNLIAISVKAVDMEHNLDISRIKKPTKKDLERLEKKYKKNNEKIINYLNKRKGE